MSKIIYDDIQDINVSWENYAGSSVEKFIKSELNNRAGYLYRSSSKEGDYYYLYGFTDYEQYSKWADGDTSINPLFKVQLPNLENDTFSVNLTTTSSTSKIVNLGDGVKLSLKYTSVSTNPISGVTTDTYNDGTLIIQRSANGSAYGEVARITISPVPHQSTQYTEIDITDYLEDGDNKIRLRVEDNVNGSMSANLTFQSIINTTLKVENATPTSQPINALQLQYYLQGQINKTLHVNISQGGISKTFNFSIGENTYVEVPYTTPLMEMDISSGIIDVESWMTVDNTELESVHITNQFYYSKEGETGTIIILNEVSDTITNYTNAHLFDMVLYNQGGDVEVSIKSQDAQTTYLTLNLNNRTTGVEYNVYGTLEIDSQVDSLVGIVTVKTDTFTCEPYTITIDNTEKMSPTVGASFVLNPKTRNNSESTPGKIINEATGATVSSVFTGFGFITDGWLPDENNIQVLRIPAEHKLTISYDVLDSLTDGTTIELDFKTFNFFNDTDEVFKFYSETGGVPLGFVLKPTEATFLTLSNQDAKNQDVIFQEDTRTHLAINIVPNLANSGLNYIRMFINGVLNREILYETTDIFKNGDLVLEIGSDNCDLDIYGIRVYKKGLSASNVRQDYMSSIPNSDDKIAFKSANNILSANGTISYDKAKVLYNTLVWTGQVPSYSTGDESYRGSLEINIVGDSAHSGEITNLKIKGQGSSSKNYWKWNHQYDMNKYSDKSVFTNLDNESFSGYALTENDPLAKKLVAKLNWASSMQSHKIGSTAFYNDYWKKIVGGNGITSTEGYENARVCVHELPFLYFVKETESSQPVFYGLMTFGSGKYDKPTYGYDSDVFPDYLILEGTDNGMPLTLRQVPWFDEEVTYNENEEYYEYAGQGNLDYGMGNQAMLPYFKDAFNFTYQCSPFLAYFTGSIPENANRSYQYWDTETRNVYRYDYISGGWVNAGLTRTTEEVETENGVTTQTNYGVLNLETQTGLLRSSYSSDASYNSAVRAWRINYFRNRIDLYYNTTDVLFSMCILKLIGASDNWCKNTYEYVDPVTHKICLSQDDMDTLMLTDNVGRKTKPYYVEEHDLDSTGKPYFNGSDNVFFNLMEMAFDAEEKNMMNRILNQMRTDYGSANGCLQNYFFSVQDYFPAVAFNETARLLYEEAAVAYDNGEYENATSPIKQSLGNQLEAEKQWWRRRLPYLQSWASAHPFYTRSTVAPSIMFRSLTTINGNRPSYQFLMTPWQYLYPKVGTGQGLSSDSTRVPALTLYTTDAMSVDGNTDTFIYGSDYYTSFGEFGGISLGGAFQLNGKRLLEFSADSRNVSSYEFRPTSMTINCPALKRLVLYGCSTLGGSLDITGTTKLETVDLRGTGLTSISFPSTESLTSVYIPNITSITLVECPNLETFQADSFSNLISLTTDNSEVAESAIRGTNNLSEIHLQKINLDFSDSDIASTRLYDLLLATGSTATGSIALKTTLTREQKTALVNKYGNIDSSSNDLYITYTTSTADSFTLEGPDSLAQGRSATFTANYEGNDAKSITWTIQNAAYVINYDTVTITAPTDSLTDISVSCVITKVEGTALNQIKLVDVIENIPLTGIELRDVEFDGSVNSMNLLYYFSPSNFTTSYVVKSVTLTANDYVELTNYGDTNLTLTETTRNNTDTVGRATLTLTILEDGENTLTATSQVYITNPIEEIIVGSQSMGLPVSLKNKISLGIYSELENVNVGLFADYSNNLPGLSGIVDSGGNNYGYQGCGISTISTANQIKWIYFNSGTYPSYIPPVAIKNGSISTTVYVNNGESVTTTNVSIPSSFENIEGHYSTFIFRILSDGTAIFDQSLSSIL